jgi:hypothetical protein
MAGNAIERYVADQLIIDDPARDKSEEHLARCRQAFWEARYKRGKHGDVVADTFIWLWMDIIAHGKSHSISGQKHISRDIEKFFAQPKLSAAMDFSGNFAVDLLLFELTDSAKVYFYACMVDAQYGSWLASLIKLKEKEVAAKAAYEASNYILAALVWIGDQQWVKLTIKAVWTAYPLIFTAYPDLLGEMVHQLDSKVSKKILDIVAVPEADYVPV